MENEIWKDIPGYEGKYQASTLGRIRSVDRKVRCGRDSKGIRTMKGRILKPGMYCKSGHVSVVLGHNANGSPVHALVALTFIGPRPTGMDICHADGDPLNNAVSNLRYDTRQNNILDVYKQGKAWRTIDEKTALEVIDRLRKGERCTEIAKSFGISVYVVYRIKQGRTFKWLTR